MITKKTIIRFIVLVVLVVSFFTLVLLTGCGRHFYNVELKQIPLASIDDDDIDVSISEKARPSAVTVIYTDPEIPDPQFTEEEISLIARVLKSKGDDLPLEGKLAIVATIVNRVNSAKYPNTIEAVIKDDIEQYSLSRRGDPDDDCYIAIDLYADNDYPEDMFYFSIDQPHYLGYPFMKIGDVYFSTEERYGN